MRPSSWHALQRNAMRGPFGWARPAARYLQLYAELTDARPARRDLSDAVQAPAAIVNGAHDADVVTQRRRPARRAASATQTGAWNGNAPAQTVLEDVARRA